VEGTLRSIPHGGALEGELPRMMATNDMLVEAKTPDGRAANDK
jgi:hypothetical protein